MTDTGSVMQFLLAHQPMPADSELTDELIDEYAAALEFLRDRVLIEAVQPLLHSFGAGDGRGVYQLVDGVLDQYPRDTVLHALMAALSSPNPWVRFWNLQVAMNYPSVELVPCIRPLLSSDDATEQELAAFNLQQIEALC